ncbi:hypothetical protein F7725_017673, partial [Dissostichus mawsoni]
PPPPPPADPDPDPVPVPAPAPASVKFEGLTKTNKMKVKWSDLGLAFFIVLSLMKGGSQCRVRDDVSSLPRALQLEHPIPSLKEALEKVRGVVCHAQNYN